MKKTNKISYGNIIYDYIYKDGFITPFWEEKKTDELFIKGIKKLIRKYIKLKGLADDTVDRIHKLGKYYVPNFYLNKLISDYKLKTKSSVLFYIMCNLAFDKKLVDFFLKSVLDETRRKEQINNIQQNIHNKMNIEQKHGRIWQNCLKLGLYIEPKYFLNDMLLDYYNNKNEDILTERVNSIQWNEDIVKYIIKLLDKINRIPKQILNILRESKKYEDIKNKLKLKYENGLFKEEYEYLINLDSKRDAEKNKNSNFNQLVNKNFIVPNRIKANINRIIIPDEIRKLITDYAISNDDNYSKKIVSKILSYKSLIKFTEYEIQKLLKNLNNNLDEKNKNIESKYNELLSKINQSTSLKSNNQVNKEIFIKNDKNIIEAINNEKLDETTNNINNLIDNNAKIDLINLVKALYDAGVSELESNSFASYLTAAYLHKIPVLLAGSSGVQIATVFSASVFGSEPYIFDCKCKYDTSMIDNMLKSKNEVVIIKHFLATKLRETLTKLFSENKKFYILTTPFYEDLSKIVGLYINIVPFITELIIDKPPINKTLEFLKIDLPKPISKTLPLHNELLNDMMLAPNCVNQIQTLLNEMRHISGIDSNIIDFKYVFFPYAYAAKQGECIAKEWIKVDKNAEKYLSKYF